MVAVAQHKPYSAHGAALQLWKCRDREILIEGPAGTGKTRGILEKVHYCCMKYAGMRALLVRQTRESMSESVLVTYEDKVLPAGSPMAEGPQRRLRANYTYPNGSVIVVGGLDKPDKIMSTEYDIIAVFEGTETKLNAYESLLTRLRNGVMPYQQIMVDCNPGIPGHWLNIRAKQSGMTRLLSRHTDNPRYYDIKRETWTREGTAYLQTLEGLTGVRRRRLLKGEWAAAEGMVYDNWDHQIHVVEPFPIPRDWYRMRSIDFGYVNPFVCQWWAFDPDKRMYLYREIYQSSLLVQDAAHLIKAYEQGENISLTVCDHDAEDRATLEREGIYTYPARKMILPGIEAVKRRLRTHEDGKPRLMVFEGATVRTDSELRESGHPTGTAEEFESYSYPEKKPDKTQKDLPEKKYDHGMDAARYAVAEADDIDNMIIEVVAESAAVV